MDNLEVFLRKVEKIDEQILTLLNERFSLTSKLAQFQMLDSSSYNPTMQDEILKRLTSKNCGPISDEIIYAIYREIFAGEQKLNQPMKVAFLGPLGTFSHQATLEVFGSTTQLVPLKTIPEVFRVVECNRANYGCVPIENSAEGVINYTMDWLVKSNVKIIAEKYCRIHHFLMAKCQKNEIKRIYSHPQVLGQCQHYLLENFPGIELVEMASTVYAAQKAAQEEYSAALGSPIASKLYGLNILEENVEDSSSNTTRFLVIGTENTASTNDDKTSICFVVKNRPGALYEALEPFRRNQLQMTLIESRPWQQNPGWEYCFFVDILGHQSDPKVSSVCQELEKNSAFFKILGSYPRIGLK